MRYQYHLLMKEKNTFENVQSLISNKISEDDKIDYKQQVSKDLPKIASSFLNTIGGHLVLGVKEENEFPTEITGIERKEISYINQQLKDSIRPQINIQADIIDIPEMENKVIVVYKFSRKEDTWYLSKGRFFIRQGDSSNHLLSELEIAEWKKNHPENFSNKIESFREDYLLKLKNKHSKIHFYGFPIEILAQTSSLSISDIFIPIPLVLNKDYEIQNQNDAFLKYISNIFPFIEDFSKTNMQQLSREIYEFSDIDLQFKYIGYLLRSYQKLVVLGFPGAGKSTLMSFISQYFSSKNKVLFDVKLELVPFYIEAKKYASYIETKKRDGNSYSLLDYLVYELRNSFSFNISKSQLRKQIEVLLFTGEALILIDALDEISIVSLQKELVSIIQSFSAENRNARFLITSRTLDYNLYSFPDDEFIHAYISPLKPHFIKDFIKKWFLLTELDKSVREEKTKYLSTKISENITLLQLASNPLILTLLCLTLEVGAAIPSQKFDLYTNLSKTLAVTREEVKEISSIIPFEYLEQILSEIAFNMLVMIDNSQKPTFFNRNYLIKTIKNFYEREFNYEKLQALNKAKEIFEEFIKRPLILVPSGENFVFWHQSFLDYYATLYMRRLYLENKQKFECLIQEKVNKNHWWEICHLIVESLDEISRKMANEYTILLLNILEKLKTPNNYLLRRIAQKSSVNEEQVTRCKKFLISALESKSEYIWATAIIELQALIPNLNEDQERLIVNIIFSDINKFQRIFKIQSKQIAPLNQLLKNLSAKNKNNFEYYLKSALKDNELVLESTIVEMFIKDEISYDLIDAIITLHELPLEKFLDFYNFRHLLKNPIDQIEKLKIKNEEFIRKIFSEIGLDNVKRISIKELSITISFLNKSLNRNSFQFEPSRFILQPFEKQKTKEFNNLIISKSEYENELKLNHLTWISDTILDFFEGKGYEKVDIKFNFFANGKPISTYSSLMPTVILTPEEKIKTYTFNINEGFYFDNPLFKRFRIKINKFRSGFSLKYVFKNEERLNNWLSSFKDLLRKMEIFGFRIIEEEEVHLIKNALELLKSKQYEELINLTTKMLELDPSYEPAYRLKAKALGGSFQIEDSMKVCELYENLFKTHKDIELQKVANYVNLCKYTEALELIDILEKKYEYNESEILFLKGQKGVALYKKDKNNTKKAVKLFNEIMKEDPQNYRSFYHKAIALTRIEKDKQCLKFLNRKKSDIANEFPLILVPRILCYIGLGQIDDAVNLYFELQDTEIYYGLIITSENKSEIKPFLDKILEMDPENENALIAKAITEVSKNMSKSLKMIDQVTERYPKSGIAWFFKGVIEMEAERKDDCVSSIVKAVNFDSNLLNNIRCKPKLEDIREEILSKL